MSGKAQIWSLDFMIATAVLIFGLIFFYIYSINLTSITKDNFAALSGNAKVVSGYLVDTGYPVSWTPDNVSLIGLTDGSKRINPSKIENAKELSEENYSFSKKALSTQYDYYIFFENKSSQRIRINGVDWIGKDYSAESPKEIIKLYRFVTYNSSIIRMGLYLW